MGTFSLWHWAIVLLVLSVLFGAGRQSASAGLRFGAITFLTGVVTSALAVLIVMTVTFGDVERALNRIGDSFGLYAMSLVSSGLVWLGLGFGLRALGPPRGSLNWVVRIAATGFALSLLSEALSIGMRLMIEGGTAPTWLEYYANPMAWFGFLQHLPTNVLVFLRAALLVRLAAGPLVRAPAWSPGPSTGHRPDQVTRILCGQAILGAPAFRRGVLKFFEDRWTAAAPEFGLDAELLANVCRRAEKQEEHYTWIYAGLAVIGVLIAMISVMGPVFFLLITAIARYQQGRAQRELARSFSVLTFNQETASERFAGVLEWETAAALPREELNVVVYRDFMPFVGAGLDLGGWSFVTSTDRPQVVGGERDIHPFTVLDLYRAVEAGIRDAQIPGLRCRDLFFVRGLDLRNMPTLLPDLAERPRQRIGDDLARLYLEEHNTLVRDYKCIQVFDWGGELVASYFLRCSLQSTSLMVEFKRFLLPRCKTACAR